MPESSGVLHISPKKNKERTLKSKSMKSDVSFHGVSSLVDESDDEDRRRVSSGWFASGHTLKEGSIGISSKISIGFQRMECSDQRCDQIQEIVSDHVDWF